MYRNRGIRYFKMFWVTVALGLFLAGCGGQTWEKRGDAVEAVSEDGASGSLGENGTSGGDSGGFGENGSSGGDLGDFQEDGDSDRDAAKDFRENGSAAEGVLGEKALRGLISDACFRECVWFAAGLKEEDTKEEILQKLAQCEWLILQQDSREKALRSLDGLALLPNLRSLAIDLDQWDSSAIGDFSSIGELGLLEELYICYDKEEEIDLSFLAGMDTVTNLFLPNCRIQDVSFLGEMTQLERLSLYRTPVDDVSFLRELTGLVELTLAGNAEAAHMEAVGELIHMEDLGLQDCGIEDIGFLSGLTNLRGINLNGNSVTDLSPLQNLSGLQRLGLADNNITDISVLSGMPELFDLALDGNAVSDISALRGLHRLNQVGLSGNEVCDLSPLAGKDELIYLAVQGNPVEDLGSVLDTPLLHFMHSGVSEEAYDKVNGFMQELCPEIDEYICMDYAEGDLDGNGMTDIAFVVQGEFDTDWEFFPEDRRLYIMMQDRKGQYKMLQDAPGIEGSQYGGMRGNPYRGIFLGNGYFVKASAWGSRSGGMDLDVYRYRKGSLERVMSTVVYDDNFADGYDVTVRTQEENQRRYVIVSDGYRLVRVELESPECPGHRAFPRIDLYDGSFLLYEEKRHTDMEPAAALELFWDVTEGAIQMPLPYESWQKENYELLTGVELPDCYYVISDGQEDSDDFFFYDGLEFREGECYHRIRYIREDRSEKYLIHDVTGAIFKKEVTGILTPFP